MKKFLAILLAAMMLLATAGVAFADTAATTTYTITAPKVEENTTKYHTYEIYQIFTGEYANNKLSNIKYGADTVTADNVGKDVPTEVLDDLTEVSSKTIREKLAVIETLVSIDGTPSYTVDNDPSNDTAEGAEKILSTATVPAGYYLIRDKATSQDDQHDAYTTYLVEVGNNIQITPKSVYPTVDKEVYDEPADAEGNAADGWGETADHELFENFKFKLNASLPEDLDYEGYETYSVIFKDTMSDGITFVQIDSVIVDGQDAAGKYSHTLTDNNLDVSIADVKAIDGVDLTNGAEIVVTYTAYLNENAVTYKADATVTEDNKNTVYLEYSNNPNASGEGHTPEGKTPEDSVWVFAYEIDVTKNTPNSSTEEGAPAYVPLAGAGFTLYTDANCTNAVPLLTDGTTTYLVNLENKEMAADSKYSALAKNEIITTADGKFTIEGLDAGTYYLKETTTPAGYNTCPVQTISVSATHTEATPEAGDLKLSDNTPLSYTITNYSGTVLPSTGGIGTTLFYMFGGIMAAGSALMLVVRRRADAEEE